METGLPDLEEMKRKLMDLMEGALSDEDYGTLGGLLLFKDVSPEALNATMVGLSMVFVNCVDIPFMALLVKGALEILEASGRSDPDNEGLRKEATDKMLGFLSYSDIVIRKARQGR